MRTTPEVEDSPEVDLREMEKKKNSTDSFGERFGLVVVCEDLEA
jgi:hypothetical protein